MVSYFRPNDLLLSVESVISHTSCPYRLTLIDNSHGGLDRELSLIQKRHLHVVVLRNEQNIGKGASYRKWYSHIMAGDNNKYFVSMDADVIVPQQWLESLLRAAAIVNAGVLAPLLLNNADDSLDRQVQNRKLTMHGFHEMQPATKSVYYNSQLAGPLLLISKRLYEKCGGYPGDQLYAHDDGVICKAAKSNNLFVGIETAVCCIHSTLDDTPKYRDWKQQHFNNSTVRIGYWDQ